MTIQGVLYDAGVSPPVEIASMSLQTQRRILPAGATALPAAKGAGGWIIRAPGFDGGLEMRVIASGVISQGWLARLYARQTARSCDAYLVALGDGDSHSGAFLVETLDENPGAEGARRTFRLVLLSSGTVNYVPAA